MIKEIDEIQTRVKSVLLTDDEETKKLIKAIAKEVREEIREEFQYSLSNIDNRLDALEKERSNLKEFAEGLGKGLRNNGY